MGKSTAWAAGQLALLYNATGVANIADNTATSPLTNIFVALHTGDPGVAGSQNTSEVAYTSYGRVAVARTSGGWTQSSNQIVNAALVSFPKATGVADNTTAQFWSTGSLTSGAGVIYHSGPLASLLGPGVAESADNTIRFGLNAVSGVVTGQKIIFIASPNGVTPGGVATNTVYFVKTVSGDQLTISATSGGATLTITSDGSGYWAILSPLQITQNVQPQVSAGQILITES